jgi:carbamoyltransferase
MKILGIGSYIWISSAAIIEDGKVVAAAAEERFNRQKVCKDYPRRAIDYCLKEAGLRAQDIDYVAVSWNPAAHIYSASTRYSDSIRWRGEYLYAIPSLFFNRFSFPGSVFTRETFDFKGKNTSFFFVNHHHAHAANAYLLSPFEEAAILTVDGRGEQETCFFGKGRSNKIKDIQSVFLPHSLGSFYAAITEYLGFKPDSDEWKVMALASYAKPGNKYYQKLKKIIRLNSGGSFELDLTYFGYYLFDRQPRMYTQKLVELLGPSRQPEEELTERHKLIAQGLQQVFEETMFHLLNHLYSRTKCKNLVFGGGCAMNSVFNGKILEATRFKKLFITSCPDDSGTSLGAALYVYNCLLGKRSRYPQQHNFWGPGFSNNQIRQELEKCKLKYVFYADIAKESARLIAQGKLIGWFQGRMELGQRSLGNRSILADPRKASVKDLVNKAVKYREAFRPFAPSVLEEEAAEYFAIPAQETVPFMEKVYRARPAKAGFIPAVVHIDGTARLQTVSKDTNHLFYRLIKEFKRITGIPVVLNTSFNLNKEPIVCTVQDAVRTFISCGLDYLALGNYLIAKDNTINEDRHK